MADDRKGAGVVFFHADLEFAGTDAPDRDPLPVAESDAGAGAHQSRLDGKKAALKGPPYEENDGPPEGGHHRNGRVRISYGSAKTTTWFVATIATYCLPFFA